MHSSIQKLVFIAAAAALLACPSWSFAAAEHNPVAREPRRSSPARLDVIVKLRRDTANAVSMKAGAAADRLEVLSKRSGIALTLKREISPSMLAGRIESPDELNSVLARLRADPSVEWAVPDHRRYPHATQPNDSLFDGQWYLKNTEIAAVNAVDAWDRETGRSGIVVAVLDTGVLYDHPDLGRGDRGGRLLPGYDFVTAPHITNDGNTRDADPSDPGDWVNSTDKADPVYSNCDLTSSSWHGTRVAGMIGALTNNSSGVAGLSWSSYILPVRVLGKCGGNDSDILAGLRWAAGLPVAGAPVNPTPARILNASFGNSGPCEPSYQEVIDELTARKVLLVISAGNEGTVVSSPANCSGVVAVAAIRHAGSKVGFSSLGPEVTLAAPGGNCVNVNGGPCLFSLDTTSNSGSEGPGSFIFTDQLNSNLGTSFSAPIVSGIAALMVARNGNLSTRQMSDRLREAARPFPTSVADDPNAPICHVPVNDGDIQLAQCICTTSTCGAGMADAANAVDAAERPIAAISVPSLVSAGQMVNLDASGSAAACNRTVATFQWVVHEPGGNPPVILDPGSANASVLAPTSGSITLRVTVTDNLGRTDSADVTLEPNRALSAAPSNAGTTPCIAAVTSGPTPGAISPTPDPPPSHRGGGGGGGGLFDAVTLLLLLMALSRLASRRRPL